MSAIEGIQQLEDFELVQRIEGKDEHALSELYDRYGTIVYSLCYRVAQNSAIAEEAVQDTFLKVWNRADRWDSAKGQFSSWLLTIARYTTIDRLRREQRQTVPDQIAIDDAPDPPAQIGIPHDPLLQDGHLLRELLENLPPEQAQLIRLAFFQGITHRELAVTLNIPLGTVKTRVRLGLRKLRAMWIEANGEENTRITHSYRF